MPDATEGRKRGPYSKSRPHLKASRRGGRTYYSVQVPVPRDKQAAVGRRVLTRYIGAVTESEAKRRAPAVVAELQAEVGKHGEVAAIDQNRAGVVAFGPTDEQVAEARRVLEAAGVPAPAVDTALAERVTLSRIERERQAVVEGAARDAGAGTVAAEYESWLEYKAGTGRQTRSKARGERQRAKVAREFVAFVGPDKPFAEVDHADAQRFKAALLAKGLKAHTVDNQLHMIAGCFRDRRPGTLNPFAGLSHKKEVYEEQEESRADFADAQVLALLSAAEGDPAWYWFLKTAAYTGARLSELLALETGDLDPDAGVVRFNQRDAGKSPAARRAVPLHPELEGLREYAEGRDGRLFPFAASTAHRRFRELQGSVGATETTFDGQTYRVSFHSFRHGFKCLAEKELSDFSLL